MKNRLFYVILLYLTGSVSPAFGERFDPWGLLLSWQRDPATTMVVQWMEHGEALPVAPGEREANVGFSIGRVSGGSLAEVHDALEGQGFAIGFLASSKRQRFSDFSGSAKMGWNSEGLVVAFTVLDKERRVPKEIAKPWTGSSVELVLAGDENAQNITRLAIIPCGKGGLARCYLLTPEGEQELHHVKLDLQARSKGYILTALIPWSCLPGFSADIGRELRAQFYLNTVGNGGAKRLAWYPADVSGVNARLTHRLLLAEASSAPYRLAAEVKRLNGGLVCEVFAALEEAGEVVEVRGAPGVEVAGVLKADQTMHLARVELTLPAVEQGFRPGVVEVKLGEDHLQVAPVLASEDYATPEKVTMLYRPKTGGGEERREVNARRLQSWPGVFLRRVELSGLAPDTVYDLSLEGKTGGFSFRTMPASLTRPVRIAIGGDTMHRRKWLEETNRVVMQHDPDFILWGGDLADTNARQELLYRWEDWFSGIKETLVTADGRVVPVVVAIGNHDVMSGYCEKHEGYEATDAWRARLAPQFYELFPFPGQPGYAALDFGHYLSLIVLDSGHTNPIAGAQTVWLESALKARAKVPHVLPIYHVPAYPSVKDYDGKYETRVRQAWPPLFDRYAVRTAFENHNHAYKRTHPIAGGEVKEGGTVYFGDGGWGITPRQVHPASSTWYLAQAIASRYALILTLEGGKQHFTTINDGGEVIDELMLPERHP